MTDRLSEQTASALLRAISEGTTDLLFAKDLNSRILFANPAGARAVGLPLSELIGKTGIESLRPEEIEAYLANDRRIMDAGVAETVEEAMTGPDGQRVYSVLKAPLRDAAGVVCGLIGISRDITQRKETENALREAVSSLACERERLAIALLIGRLGVYEWRVETGEIWWSPETYPLYGVAQAAFKPTLASVIALVHSEDRDELFRQATLAIAQRETFVHEYRIVRPSGEVRWVANRSHIAVDAAGEIERITGIAVDITERRTHEEHVQQLMREVNHRSKNMLALVQAVARLTAVRSPEDFLPRFEERIASLARAQDLLIENEWKRAWIDDLIRAHLGHFSGLIDRRIHLQGPRLAITPTAAQSLGMAMHELATNAAKYGALSTDRGEVQIGWRVVQPERRFEMVWQERGGPPTSRPERKGFGSTVIENMVSAGLQCAVDVDFDPVGLTWRMACGVENVLAEPLKSQSDDPLFG